MHRTLALLAAWSLALAGCSGGDPSAPEPEPGGVEGVATVLPEGPGEPRAALAVADLQPHLRRAAPIGGVPEYVSIGFVPEVVARRAVNVPVSPDTVLTVDPPVDGELRWTDPSTLRFTPTGGFEPGKTYTVNLERVDTSDGVLQAPAAGAWRTSFSAPPFGLLDVRLSGIDTAAGELSIDVWFTGAVEPTEVARHLSLWHLPTDGRERTRITGFRTLAGDNARAVRVIVPGPLERLAGDLRVDLSAGVQARERGEAGAATGSVRVDPRAPQWSILSVHVVEGADSHAIEVVCDDDAVEEESWVWVSSARRGFDVSRRCVIDEASAASMITLDPPVPVSAVQTRGGFRLIGDLPRGPVTVRIAGGARSIDGSALAEGLERIVEVGARAPRLHLASGGRYLPRDAWSALPIQHRNTRGERLQIRMVPERNLAFWATGPEAASNRTADLLVDVPIALESEADVEVTSWVDVGALMPRPERGVVEVSVVDASGESAAVRMQLTDLQLVAKRMAPPPDHPELAAFAVWALDAHSAAPVSGATVELLRPSGTVVARCVTDGSGGCELTPAASVDRTEPFAIAARHGDDLTLLELEDLRTDLSEAAVHGEPYLSTRPYRAAPYADRGVYRPGDVAHVVAVVRGADDAAPPEGMPVVAGLVDPRGNLARRVTLPVNAAGMVSWDVGFDDYATLGRWRVELSAGDEPLGSLSLAVEEFVPERMKVAASATAEDLHSRDVIGVEVDARYLFGGSAEGSTFDVSCRLEPGELRLDNLPGYRFGPPTGREGAPRGVDLGTATGVLDAQGHGVVQCPRTAASAGAANAGTQRLVAEVAVFEGGSGRASRGTATASVHPADVYVGLRTGTERAEPGRAVEVDGVIVDWSGAVVDAYRVVDVELVRLEREYGWVYDPADGSESWRTYMRPVPEGRQRVDVAAGRFHITAVPQGRGAQYEVRVFVDGAASALRLDGSRHYWWSGEDDDRTPRPLKPKAVALELPERVELGERATATATAPFAGRMLFTLETHEVLRSEWRDVEAGDVSWTFQVDDFVPNVYVSALLVKDPHLESAASWLPDRAFGVGSVRVEPTALTHTLKLDVPEQIRSNSTLTVGVDVGPVDGPTWVTVAAVDEGILQLTRFESPDPQIALLPDRALGVESFETFGWSVLLPPRGPQREHGGDGDGGSARVQMVKPVALWSGLVQVPASGRVEVPLEVPSHRGELRVMAVSAGARRTGHADAPVAVRDPIVLQTTLPRFLASGDRFELPVFVTNTTDRRREVEVAIDVGALPDALFGAMKGAPVRITSERTVKLALEPGKSASAIFAGEVTGVVGAARFEVVARSGGEAFTEALDVPLSASGPRSRVVERVELEQGPNDLSAVLDAGWLPTTGRTTLWVTSNPYGQAMTHLDYLLRYPYGCVEQTASTLLPLLTLRKLVPAAAPGVVTQGAVDEMVRDSISRLLAMQTPDGGFGYWAGDREAHGWGTAYAVHVLLVAREAGYDVPAARLDSGLAWASNTLANADDRRGRYRWFDHAEAYLHYVTALGGKGNKAAAEGALARVARFDAGVDREDAFLLRAALFRMGDRRFEADLRHPDTSAVRTDRSSSWSFYSDLRRRALMLNVHEDLFGVDDPDGEPLAQLVYRSLVAKSRSSWYTTQELAWGVAGLGRRVADSPASFGDVSLRVDGARRPATTVDPKPGDDLTFAAARLSEAGQVAIDVGQKGEGKLYLLVQSEGILPDATWELGAQGVAVTRRVRDAAGVDVGADAPLGSVMYVELTVENRSGAPLPDLALVDRLPAGWEIENPRLGQDQRPAWVQDRELWRADHVSLGDDRVQVFGELASGATVRFVYAVRAVTAGRYTHPPVEVEAMYDPTVWARAGGGEVQVVGPWAE